MPRLLTAEMLYFNHHKIQPCHIGMADFERLFNTEVYVTKELCRQHAELFKPWGAIAYMLLPDALYFEWSRQWDRYGTVPKGEWAQYTEDGAAAFASMFNRESPWNISA